MTPRIHVSAAAIARGGDDFDYAVASRAGHPGALGNPWDKRELRHQRKILFDA